MNRFVLTRFISLLIMGLLLSPTLLFSLSRVDSLKSVFMLGAGSNDEQGLLAFKIADQYLNTAFLDSALHYADIGLKLSDHEDADQKMMYYDLSGQIYYRLGNYILASRFFNQGMALAVEMDNEKRRAFFSNSLGVSYATSGDYTRALESFQDAYQYVSRNGSEKKRLLAKKNLAKLYGKLFQMDEAISMLKELKEEASKTEYHRISCRVSMLMAEYYEELEIFDKAEEEAKYALAIAKERGYIEEVTSLGYLGKIYQKTSRDELAFEYLQQGLSLAREKKRKPLISDLLNFMGDYFIHIGDYKKGQEYLLEALSLADSSDHPRLKVLYEKMAQSYRYQKDYVNADKYGLKAKAIGDEIYSADNANRIAELEANFQFEEKRFALQQQIMKKNRERFHFWLAFIGCAFVFSIIAIYIFFQIREKRQTKRLKSEIELNDKILSAQRKLIEKQRQLMEILKKLKEEEEEE